MEMADTSHLVTLRTKAGHLLVQDSHKQIKIRCQYEHLRAHAIY